MTERDFVLNKIIYSDWTASEKNITELKAMYKTICENTSEESETITIDKEDLILFVDCVRNNESYIPLQLAHTAVVLKDKYLK